MDHLRSNENMEKTKRTSNGTHGGDGKTRPITNHERRGIRRMRRANKREDAGIKGGVERGPRVNNPLGGDKRCRPHGVECLR
jgi:hypothetical protein